MIDGTREGEVDAAYVLRIDKAGSVVVEVDRDLKVGFIDHNAAAVAVAAVSLHFGRWWGAVRMALI